MLRHSFATKFVTMCCGKSVSFYSTKGEIHGILTRHLKVDDKVISKIDKINVEKTINKIPRNQIIRNCTMIKNMGVSLKEIKYLPQCLMLQPMIMKNRILILREMGAKDIGLDHIFRFPASMRKSTKKFKELHNIPTKEDIMKTLFVKTDLLKHKPNISSIKCVNSITRTGDYYEMCLSYYKTFYLKLCDGLFYKSRKLKYQSFREISKLLDVLKTGCQFDMNFLKKNRYLLNLDVDDVEKFLNEFKYINIDGKGIIDIVRKCPRILFHDTDEIKELLQLYKVLGLSDQSIISHLNVMSMNRETFLERYTNITKRRELAMWLQHPRILPMIYNYKIVLDRADFLRSLNHLTAVNINTYLSSKKFFLRFVEGDVSHTAMRKYLLYILRKELGEDKVSIIHSIRRHPYWKNVSLLHVEIMLRYLKKYYTIEDICLNIHIILYPRSKVIDVLNSVYKEYSPQEGYDFAPTQYLALCLYKLEKKHHFSGDAIWQTVHTEMSDLNPHIFEDIELNESDKLVKVINNDNDDQILNSSGAAWLEYLLQSQ
ncbi:mitochondrial transcription termination factor 5 [Xylocopa sonorina]|uniref:mitochondrial transcription termination factor 5 n=1 Tax=Xylocopa sonorina TaxID=1818115 RepID=UPI00403AC7E8